MTRHEQLLEQYEDAYFALLMESVAQAEGARLEQLNIELQNNPETVVSKKLDQRCLKTIHRQFSHAQRSKTYRLTKKIINVAAILISTMVILFTTAFAASANAREKTLTLVIAMNEKFSHLHMQNLGSISQNMGSNDTPLNPHFEDILLNGIPSGYQYASGEYNINAVFYNAAGDWIMIDRHDAMTQIIIDTENADVVEPFETNDCSGICVVKNGQTHIALANTKQNIFITISAAKSVSRNVVESFAKNILIN